MATEIRLTTTGTLNPVSIADFGNREFAHPTVNFNLLLEFSEDEIRDSKSTAGSLQSAIDAGHITLSDELGNPITDVEEASAHVHDAGDIVTGTLNDARVGESSITQHEAAIDHNALDNYEVDQHRVLDDSLTTLTNVWSAQKIATLIDATLKPPEAYDSAGSGNFPVTYGGSSVEQGDTFRIATADTYGSGTIVNPEDLLIALADAPAQTDANWMVVESNRDQATETVKGVLKIATTALVTALTDDTTAVTPLKLKPLSDLVTDHIADTNNPHNVKGEDVDTRAQFIWDFDDTDTAETAPDNKSFKLNNVDPALATKIFIDNDIKQSGSINASAVLAGLKEGDKILLGQLNDRMKSMLVELVSVTDNTDWFTLEFTVLDGASPLFTDGKPVGFVIIPKGAGPDSASSVIGSYTGDGELSQSISGLGFEVKFVRINESVLTDNTTIDVIETSSAIITDNAAGQAIVISNGKTRTGGIISLDINGFTVGDNGGPAGGDHPNKLGQLYRYIAIGI